jgi:hypothetical protein
MSARILPLVLLLAWSQPLEAQQPWRPASAAIRADAGSGTADAVAREARVALDARRWERAAELYRSALLLDGRDPARWDELARALFESGRHRAAIAAYQRAIQLDGERTRDAAWKIARIYARMGNAKQAARWTELAMRAGMDGGAGARGPGVPDDGIRGDRRRLFGCGTDDSFRAPGSSPSDPPSRLSTCEHDRPRPSAPSCSRSSSSPLRCTASPPTATARRPIA